MIDNPQQQQFLIDYQLWSALIVYLGERPYKEVAGLIDALRGTQPFSQRMLKAMAEAKKPDPVKRPPTMGKAKKAKTQPNGESATA